MWIVLACANTGARCAARMPARPVAAMPAPVAFRNFLRFIAPPPWMNFAAIAAALTQSAFAPAQCQLFPPASRRLLLCNIRHRMRALFLSALPRRGIDLGVDDMGRAAAKR